MPSDARPSHGFRGLTLRFLAATSIAAAAVTASAEDKPPDLVSKAEARTPAEEREALRVPAGFEVQLVAAEPDIHKPLNIAFDDRGRLWVTETIEYPFPAQGRPGRDSVKILSDFGPDGRARKVETFADGLNIPIGLIPMPDCRSALVHSIPNILRLIDDDGDGKADRREPAYSAFGFRDTHGMTNAFHWGFDGWIYACHGFSNTSSVAGKDKHAITMTSGNTYRMRPDGTHVEQYTHGQVNPFGLALDPLGRFYTCDCHSRPIYQILRGAWYPSFGAPHDGLGFGPEMMSHDHGSTGIAGIVNYQADQFPPAYLGRVMIGNVVTNRINQDVLEWRGSTPKALQQPDFLTSDDDWFRPVDLKIGPDGAMYVADFYNRIIGHYEVPLTHPGRDRERGRIWRIVYRGTKARAPLMSTLDLTKATLDELIALLGDANMTLRLRAANQVVERFGSAGRPTSRFERIAVEDSNVTRRVHALWILERWGDLRSDLVAKAAEAASPEPLRVHAMRVLAEFPGLTTSLRGLVFKGLRDVDAVVRSAAAETLAVHPDAANIRPLLDARHVVDEADTHLTHVIRMALRDQLRAVGNWEKLKGMTLDEADRRAVADVATGVPSAEAASYLAGHLEQVVEPLGNRLRYVHHAARFGDAATRLRVEAYLGGVAGKDTAIDLAELWRADLQGTQEGGARPSEKASAAVAALAGKLLTGSARNEVSRGVELATTLRSPAVWARLEELAVSGRAAEANRAAALGALAAIDPLKSSGPLGRVLADETAPFGLRQHAAGVLAATNRPEGRSALSGLLQVAPARLQTSIAEALSRSREGVNALLDAVEAGKASPRLLQTPPVDRILAGSDRKPVRDRAARLVRGLPPADQRINSVIASRKARYQKATRERDPAAGLKIFEKNCAACHQTSGAGGRVGPQLDGIGVRGVERLLEDVLDPNRNVDQTFRATTLALRDGRVLSGLLLREEGAVLILADAQGKEQRVPSSEVEERKVQPISPMPANFVDQIGERDFELLLDYLLSRTEKAPADAKTPAK